MLGLGQEGEPDRGQWLAHSPGWWCVAVAGCAGPPLFSCWQGWFRPPLLWLTLISIMHLMAFVPCTGLRWTSTKLPSNSTNYNVNLTSYVKC